MLTTSGYERSPKVKPNYMDAPWWQMGQTNNVSMMDFSSFELVFVMLMFAHVFLFIITSVSLVIDDLKKD